MKFMIESGKKQTGDKCIVCDQKLSEFTAARVSHFRKHVKDGSFKEEKEDGKFIWITTGKNPREKKKPIRNSFIKTQKFDPRTPVTAKSNKKEQISIKCKKCKKWSMSRDFIADERFLVVLCCDSVSSFPKRLKNKLIANHGVEFTE